MAAADLVQVVDALPKRVDHHLVLIVAATIRLLVVLPRVLLVLLWCAIALRWTRYLIALNVLLLLYLLLLILLRCLARIFCLTSLFGLVDFPLLILVWIHLIIG